MVSFFILCLVLLYHSYLPDIPHPNHFPPKVLAKPRVEIENRLLDCQAHTHTRMAPTCHKGLKCKLPSRTPSSLFLTHTPWAGLWADRADRGEASDSVLWKPSNRARVIVYNCLLSAGPALINAMLWTHQCLPHKGLKVPASQETVR